MKSNIDPRIILSCQRTCINVSSSKPGNFGKSVSWQRVMTKGNKFNLLHHKLEDYAKSVRRSLSLGKTTASLFANDSPRVLISRVRMENRLYSPKLNAMRIYILHNYVQGTMQNTSKTKCPANTLKM